MKNSTIGVIGLGKMGASLALQALEKGYQVVGHDQSSHKELEQQGIQLEATLIKFVRRLPDPKIIFLYIPAGPGLDKLLNQLAGMVSEGDVIIDGGNSYWGDSILRARQMKEKKIHFIDCGTSGGVDGARHGACFMAGGEQEAIDLVAPVLKDLATENGFFHTGPSGSGHFVKLVHNGIEFGMLQSIGEGMDLLAHYRNELDLQGILKVWNHGSVIRSWLIELMEKIYTEQHGFQSIPSYIEDTGEVNWLVADALRMEVPTPVIAQAVMQLFSSRDTTHISNKAVAMMRHGFGGHPFGADSAIAEERKSGKTENSEDHYLYEK